MAIQSAGILLYRNTGSGLEVFLVHPGGPYYRGKDDGHWSIPKGEFEPGEDGVTAAKREFEEETGFPVSGEFLSLGSVRQSSHKTVHAWAVAGDCDAAAAISNTFEMEWPPGSGERQAFPEVDRAAWFDIAAARRKIHPGQMELLERLCALVIPP
ncbi:MAG: NUDIX domain-containing protein [Candidatus Hydrogenedentes bacterium]|nr:NUDIX domain-containing protein [Candidatus Hydrogenedentota bacterium]